MNTALAACQVMLEELERVVPLAHATGRIKQWARLYTEGYMLKLRAMR